MGHFSSFGNKNRMETFTNAKETIFNLSTHIFIYFCNELLNKTVRLTSQKEVKNLILCLFRLSFDTNAEQTTAYGI